MHTVSRRAAVNPCLLRIPQKSGYFRTPPPGPCGHYQASLAPADWLAPARTPSPFCPPTPHPALTHGPSPTCGCPGTASAVGPAGSGLALGSPRVPVALGRAGSPAGLLGVPRSGPPALSWRAAAWGPVWLAHRCWPPVWFWGDGCLCRKS